MSFWNLPEEIIDLILPEIEHHRDLVNFACASRLCSQLVVPRHTEYRVLRLGTVHCTHIWAHLARRTDLACNIREINIEQVDAAHPRAPSSLINDVDQEKRDGEIEEEEMLRVLAKMPRLKSFSWEHRFITWPEPRADYRYFAPKVFDVLQRVGSVEHLRLETIDEFKFNEPIEECGLWKMIHLRSLLLTSKRDWPPQKLLVDWFNSLSCLELLSLPPDIFEMHHSSLFFPSLRLLGVWSSYSDINQAVLTFLERHSGIEGLTWYSHVRAPSDIASNFLPKLRQLHCRYDFFRMLVSRTEAACLPRRKIESLSLISRFDEGPFVDECCNSPGIDPVSLRLLSLMNHHSNQDVYKLAVAFPMIEELSVPRLSGQDFDFEEFLLGVEQLKYLRVLYQDVIWSDFEMEKGGWDLNLDPQMQLIVDERIQILAARCPNLVEVSHPKGYGHRLVLSRDNGEVLSQVEKAPPRSDFELHNYSFGW
ncbi:hypothetical protein BDN72DRAFT_964269 [Pluteus cervinus]|uniref:Uncharacterized protein n=1 Tax=Pluteus cervinus TaxID=181527 RepID=A0ACD3ABV9_9AGAR|nr:hypothetical protein BDN72DRAFT_964269 [Pluteus cervinus]